jgi:hypothetical protein
VAVALLEMTMLRDGWGKRQGQTIHVPERHAEGYEMLGYAERTTMRKQRVARDHLNRVTKQHGLPEHPLMLSCAGSWNVVSGVRRRKAG